MALTTQIEELQELKQQLSSLLIERKSLRDLDDEWGNYLINNDRLIEIDQEIRDIGDKIKPLLHIKH